MVASFWLGALSFMHLLPHQVTNLNFDVAISFKGKADFHRTSRRLIQENLTQHLGESATPFGDKDTGQSAHKKIFALALASPTDFFMHILPRIFISKLELVIWCGNNRVKTLNLMVWGTSKNKKGESNENFKILNSWHSN